MLTQSNQNTFAFASVEGRRVEAAFDGGTITSDAGALLLGATDRAIRLIDRFAAGFHDGRRPELIEHQVRTLAGQRVVAMALGYGGSQPQLPDAGCVRGEDQGARRSARSSDGAERGGSMYRSAPPRRATAPQGAIEGNNRGGRLKLSVVRRNRAGQTVFEIAIASLLEAMRRKFA